MSGTSPKLIGSVSANVHRLRPVVFEQANEVDAIRVKVVIQGDEYLCSKASVEWSAHGASDSAEVTIPLHGGPDWLSLIRRSTQNATIVPIQVYFGAFERAPSLADLSIQSMTQMLNGQVDLYSLVFHDDEVTFHCRSLASVLIDNRITGLQQNITTTGFVAQVAQMYNLKANVLLPAGQYPITLAEVYAHDFAVGVQNDRIWDILLKMAQVDDADVWVSGETLNYVCPKLIKRNLIDLKYGRDIETLTVEHSPLFSKNIRVSVRTYLPKTRYSTSWSVQSSDDGGEPTVKYTTKLVTSTPNFGTNASGFVSNNLTNGNQGGGFSISSGGAKTVVAGTGPLGDNGPIRYVIYAPGLATQAANLLAQSTWARLSRDEYSATIGIPLTRAILKELAITSRIRLSGTPMQYADGDNLWPRKVVFSIDPDSGADVSLETVSVNLPAGNV